MSHFKPPKHTDNYSFFLYNMRLACWGNGYDRERVLAMIQSESLPYWYKVWETAHDAMVSSDTVVSFWKKEAPDGTWQLGTPNLDAMMAANTLYDEPAQCLAILNWLHMAVNVHGFLDRFIAEAQAYYADAPLSEDEIPTLQMKAVETNSLTIKS